MGKQLPAIKVKVRQDTGETCRSRKSQKSPSDELTSAFLLSGTSPKVYNPARYVYCSRRRRHATRSANVPFNSPVGERRMAISTCVTCGSQWFAIKFKDRFFSSNLCVVRCSACGGIMECNSPLSLPTKGKIRLAKPSNAPSKSVPGWQAQSQTSNASTPRGYANES